MIDKLLICNVLPRSYRYLELRVLANAFDSGRTGYRN